MASKTTDARSDLIGQRNVRLGKIAKMRELGIDPFPSKSFRNTPNNEIINNFTKLEGKEVIVAGRLMSFRHHGKIVFGHIQDPTDRIQLYIRQEDLEPTNVRSQTVGFEDLEFFDVGDIVEAVGTVTKTERGEISVLPRTMRMLTKAIRPLPDKWAGLQDREARFRQRYLEMIMNPKAKEPFINASKILFSMRSFLNSKGFLEIKTPVLQPIHGGTNARPFKSYMNALGTDFYMAVAHELYLKRLIVAGFENVYNMTGYFRNEGIDRYHNPEFSMLETMTAYKNYEYNMELLEAMYKHIGQDVFGKSVFKVGENEIDLGVAWPRMMMIDAVKKYTKYDFDKVHTLEQAHKILDEIGYKEEKPRSIGESMVEVFAQEVEHQLIQPVFIMGHPVEISPLAKRMTSDPRFVERFELFLGGHEQGDNWTELNDPVELFERFKEQIENKNRGSEDAHPMDIEFVEAMEHGMPPTTGLGPGIERLTMLFTEKEYIDDVIFFPIMRPAPVTKQQKEIYGADILKGNEEKTSSGGQDFSKKMVLVLDEDLKGWQMTNTIGHLSAYLGNRVETGKIVSRENFETKDGQMLHANAQYAIVTLVGKQSHLRKLWKEVESDDSMQYLVYTPEMIETTNDEKLSELIASKESADIQILGVGVFGDKEKIEALTKKFSLFK